MLNAGIGTRYGDGLNCMQEGQFWGRLVTLLQFWRPLIGKNVRPEAEGSVFT